MNTKKLMAALVIINSLYIAAQAQQPYKGVVGKTLADSKEWWPTPVKAPANAPNVVWMHAAFARECGFDGDWNRLLAEARA